MSRAEYDREYYAARREKRKAQSRAYYVANRPAVIARMFEYQRANPAKRKNWQLIGRHGLALADVERMIAAQGGLCACCAGALGSDFCVDHDHETGKVRGILHGACNRGLGLLGDDIAGVRLALAYLERQK